MKKKFIYLLAVLLIAVAGCQKELSFEQGTEPSDGSLKSDINDDCLPKTVNGTYEVGKALVAATNNITVEVNVRKTGTYVINTDTINGIFFRATGSFTATGTNTVTLRGNGTPFAMGTFNFMVSYDSTFCDVPVDVLPAGAGGPAAFNLVSGGTPVNCASAVTGGIFVKDAALNASNYVDVTVNVTTIGVYTITAAGGGMTFTKSGAFLTTGNQVVRVPASGTPTTAGANTITFSNPAGGCTFTVNVVGPAVYTVNCPSGFAAGTYQAGTALGPANTITIDLNITSIGAVSITTTSTNGMVFSGSANYTTTGLQTIVLTGSGTPTAAGTTNIPIATGCTVPVTVTAAPTIDWKFTVDGVTYQGGTDLAQLVSIAPLTSIAYLGSNATDDISIALTDFSGGINANETYSTSALLSNSGSFSFDGASLVLDADPTVSGVTITYRITSHNTGTKTIIGTFSGTAKDAVNITKNVTNGQFTIVYP